MSDHGLLIASMRRVLELYFLTEPDTRVKLPSFMPDQKADPDGFAQITKMRLRFAMIQGLLNAESPQAVGAGDAANDTPFHEAAARLAYLNRIAFLAMSQFLRDVAEKRREQEDALNTQLQSETPPGWRRKRARVYGLQDRTDERLRIQLNAPPFMDTPAVGLDKDPPIYLLAQVNRNVSYPTREGGTHIQAALVVGNATFADPGVCFNKNYIHNQQTPPTRLVYSIRDLVMYYMVDFYIDRLVVVNIVERVMTPYGVNLELFRSIMERPMTQLVEYETFFTNSRDWAKATPSAYLPLRPIVFADNGDYDLTTIEYMGLSMKRFLQRNDWDAWNTWAPAVYANPARKNDEPRAYQPWLNADFPMPDQQASQAVVMALLLLEHCEYK